MDIFEIVDGVTIPVQAIVIPTNAAFRAVNATAEAATNHPVVAMVVAGSVTGLASFGAYKLAAPTLKTWTKSVKRQLHAWTSKDAPAKAAATPIPPIAAAA